MGFGDLPTRKDEEIAFAKKFPDRTIVHREWTIFSGIRVEDDRGDWWYFKWDYSWLWGWQCTITPEKKRTVEVFKRPITGYPDLASVPDDRGTRVCDEFGRHWTVFPFSNRVSQGLCGAFLAGDSRVPLTPYEHKSTMYFC